MSMYDDDFDVPVDAEANFFFDNSVVYEEEVVSELFLAKEVSSFFEGLEKAFLEKDVPTLQRMYEQDWALMAAKYFPSSSDRERPVPLPNLSSFTTSIAANTPLHKFFNNLCREMYDRHVYARTVPDLRQRFESFDNYVDIFNTFSAPEEDPARLQFDLPAQWVFDIVDEFIYQFQSFNQYLTKSQKTEDDVSYLAKNTQVWNVHSVLYYLNTFVTSSKIDSVLAADKAGDATAMKQLTEPGPTHVLRLLGYYSLIGLCRVHTLLGDYVNALKVLDSIDLSKEGPYSRLAAAYIALFYHVGFCYLMLQRYQDCTRTVNTIILFISRNRHLYARSYQYDYMKRTNERLYGLLALSLALSPSRSDDNLTSSLRDRQADTWDRYQRMLKGDLAAYNDQFSLCCPKFIMPAVINYDEEYIAYFCHRSASAAAAAAASEEAPAVAASPRASSSRTPPAELQQSALEKQRSPFLKEVAVQMRLNTLVSYMKLYTTISMDKLAKFLAVSTEEALSLLMSLKTRARQIVYDGSGVAAAGSWVYLLDIDFAIEGDMVSIKDNKPPRNQMQWFSSRIAKLENLITELSKEPTKAQPQQDVWGHAKVEGHGKQQSGHHGKQQSGHHGKQQPRRR